MEANYMQVMSPKEIQEWEKEVNDFWNNLDWNTKSRIKQLLEPILNQTKCEHNWIDPNTYENELNKTLLYCRNCHLTKSILK